VTQGPYRRHRGTQYCISLRCAQNTLACAPHTRRDFHQLCKSWSFSALKYSDLRASRRDSLWSSVFVPSPSSPRLLWVAVAEPGFVKESTFTTRVRAQSRAVWTHLWTSRFRTARYVSQETQGEEEFQRERLYITEHLWHTGTSLSRV
jgi:hypothetical protein